MVAIDKYQLNDWINSMIKNKIMHSLKTTVFSPFMIRYLHYRYDLEKEKKENYFLSETALINRLTASITLNEGLPPIIFQPVNTATISYSGMTTGHWPPKPDPAQAYLELVLSYSCNH